MVEVYLEVAVDGRCLAHVLDLPGCIVSAPGREEALRRLPDVVREYRTWVARYGGQGLAEDELSEIVVVQEVRDSGPFDPGDAAALFAPDREPVTPEEVERLLALMNASRAELLALVRDLPDEVLDWQPDPNSFSVRNVLRHVGNAEEWYVSRLLPPESLPTEWATDEDLPLFEFLEMERRTALECLRGLTAGQRSRVFYPREWTAHPEEPWTARKVLRRFLEHEREHLLQVRESLASYASRARPKEP